MLASLATRKTEIKVTTRDHFIHPGTANTEKTHVGEGVEHLEPSDSADGNGKWWEAAWPFLRIPGTEVTEDPASPLLGKHSREMKTYPHTQEKTCT